MTSLKAHEIEESRTENNLHNIHLMDYNLGGVGNLPVSIRSKQKMVTQKEDFRIADGKDLILFTVHTLRMIGRAHKVAGGIWINSASKSDLIKAIIKKKIPLSSLSRQTAQAEIMDSVPEKIINEEVLGMFRRLITIMSEEAFREYKRKIKEDKG